MLNWIVRNWTVWLFNRVYWLNVFTNHIFNIYVKIGFGIWYPTMVDTPENQTNYGMFTVQIPFTLSCPPSLYVIILGKSFKRHPLVFGVSKCENPRGNLAYSVRSYFVRTTLHILLVLVGRFVRQGVIGRAVVVLSSAHSKMCSKQHAESLCCSHLAFSQGVSLEAKWCNHTLVQHSLEEFLFYFIMKIRYPYGRLPVNSCPCFTYACVDMLLVDEILLPKYKNWSANLTGLLFNEITPCWLKHMNSCLSEFT